MDYKKRIHPKTYQYVNNTKTMKKRLILFVIILNIISLNVWGDSFSINYYHKGAIVHTQQITQGSAIGSFPNLTLTSCDDEINIFAGWINEIDASKYQTANTTTPTFITEEYVPTENTNLYAVFADSEVSPEIIWQQVKSKSELKDNDQIIITANNFNYAVGKSIDKNNHLTAIEVTKSADKNTLTPNESIQIFSLTKINDLLWEFRCENGYLGNPSISTNNTITYYPKSNDYSKWSITINSTNFSTQIRNNNANYPPYLYFYEYANHYFSCTKTTYSNLSIYKQKPIFEVNYLSCITPDAVEYSITLHDNGNTSEIKCMSNASIDQPQSTQNIKHWTFYGWATSSIEETTTTPEIISFPYTPTSNIDLYAVYSNTTADSLIMSDKTIPANWKVNETRSDDNNLSLFSILKDKITIPTVENITKIEIEARKNSTDGDFFLLTPKPSDLDEQITSIYKTLIMNKIGIDIDIDLKIFCFIETLSQSLDNTFKDINPNPIV